jgi:hypothetical protein
MMLRAAIGLKGGEVPHDAWSDTPPLFLSDISAY